MKDSAFEICPEDKCEESPWGRGQVKRLLGAGAGLIFKGSGFYITDYRSEGYQKAAKQENGATTSSTGEKSGSTGSTGKADGGSSTGSGTAAGSGSTGTGTSSSAGSSSSSTGASAK